MFGELSSYGYTSREPHTLPESTRREHARGTEARLRRVEDAWAMHDRAHGLGGAEPHVEGDG
jgi:hypothetical protein